MAPAEKVITARALTRRFGDFTAVDAVQLSVARGEVFGLLGANGAGKTTTIRMLCGMLVPDAGAIEVAGVDMVANPRRARSRIGYVSQGFALYEDLTVRENLQLQAGLYGLGGAAARERIAWALDYLALGGLMARLAGELPLGYQRRLSLACALLHEPAVLFLDEPTSGVDPLARQRFWELIYELAEGGIGILVTTHYMDEAGFCDQLALMHSGRIIARDTPEGLAARPLRTPILLLEGGHTERCSRWLEGCREVLDVMATPDGLRIRLRPDTDVQCFIASAAKEARSRGVELAALQASEPDLEDVFVALLEATGEER